MANRVLLGKAMIENTRQLNGVKEYWGLPAIARRMGCHPNTVRSLFEQRGFLMFKLSPYGPASGSPREFWYTNDTLINQWHLMQCQEQRKRHKERKHAKEKARSAKD